MTDANNTAVHGEMHRDDREEWPEGTPIGTFDIEAGGLEGHPETTGHIIFVCPNERRCAVFFGPEAKALEGTRLHVWAFDGNVERPTLTPSINCRTTDDEGKPAGGCGWHGFITKGIIA